MGYSVFRGRSLYWRRRSNCFTNFYAILYHLLRKKRQIRKRRLHLKLQDGITSGSISPTSNWRGHHRASDFIYASPYELPENLHSNNTNTVIVVGGATENISEVYAPASMSVRMTPPPLPQRNRYTPSPKATPSPTTPPISRAFPTTPSPLLHRVQVDVHQENQEHAKAGRHVVLATDNRPSSLQQLQAMDMFKTNPTNNNSEVEDEDGGDENRRSTSGLYNATMSNVEGEGKSDYLRIRRRVGYEIERRLVKAVQARTLKRKTKKKGHYHYYPFYDDNNRKSLLMRIWHRLVTPHEPDDYIRRKRRRRRRRHHRFCMKCVTSSFQSLFRYVTFQSPYNYDEDYGENDNAAAIEAKSEDAVDGKGNGVLARGVHFRQPPGENEDGQGVLEAEKRAYSRSMNNESRTPTPKMLLDLKSGALQWPVYQFGGQSGSGLVVNTEALKKKRETRKASPAEGEPGRENFSLGDKQIEVPVQFYPNKKATAHMDERKLIGWLQVRDPKNNRKSFLQVVNPAPEGPFRKAPWHGNVHVLKF